MILDVVFDSNGLTDLKVKQLTEAFPFGETFSFNRTPVQSVSSKACGLFCIFFSVRRFFSNDIPYDEFINEYFSSDLEKNEKRVKTFIDKLKNESKH